MVKSNFKEKRIKAGLRQEDLARLAGCDAHSISRYETGERVPCLEIAIRISEALKTSVNEIFLSK
ncbi:MAG: helix-turn-helix domain-containing protein [Lachnospiraceae bacterium]|nr:helix-turn-helix domain-containing protein [Lachnospiraceae bacterium]